jgi:hypothetical protein
MGEGVDNRQANHDTAGYSGHSHRVKQAQGQACGQACLLPQCSSASLGVALQQVGGSDRFVCSEMGLL